MSEDGYDEGMSASSSIIQTRQARKVSQKEGLSVVSVNCEGQGTTVTPTAVGTCIDILSASKNGV